MKIRIGKELHISWSILTQGENKPLEGRDIRLYIQDPNRRRRALEFTTDANTILVVIPAKSLTRIGRYALILTENEGQEGQTAVDANPAFTLVETTREEDTNTTEAPNLDVATINLATGNLTLRMVIQELFDGKDGGDMKTGDIIPVLRDGELHRVSAKIGAGTGTGADCSAEIEALTAKVEENAANIAGAISDASEALTAAQNAQTAASSASQNAGQAIGLANEAKEIAEGIAGKADDAIKKATEATGKADAAERAAIAAQEASQDAQATATTASENAAQANELANEAKTTAEQIQGTAASALSEATSARSDASEALTAAQNAQTAASSASQNAGQAIGLANEAKGIAEGIEGKADNALTKATEAKKDAADAKVAVENESTARTEADTALLSQINGKQDNIDSFSADEKNAFLVSLGLGKIGVISQKQNWNASNTEYTISDKVMGVIPQSFIAEWIDATKAWYDPYGGPISHEIQEGSFNEQTGYFELHGLTDLTYYDARMIMLYGRRLNTNCLSCVRSLGVRTIHVPTIDSLWTNAIGLFVPPDAEVVKCPIGWIAAGRWLLKKSAYDDLNSQKKLHTIEYVMINGTHVTNLPALRNCKIIINGNGVILNLAKSPLLTIQSVKYMIELSYDSCTITLHKDVYDAAMADESILAALEAHTNISLALA